MTEVSYYQDGDYVEVYINGQYWERFDSLDEAEDWVRAQGFEEY